MPQQIDYSSFNPLDVVGSPFYNILHTASGLPLVDQSGLRDWLETSPTTQGVRNYQEQHPGWATAEDIGAAFIPYAGWGGALGRAGLEGAGALQAVNRAGVGAANLFRGSAPLAFAAGETVRYAPLAAGITAFDLAGGNYHDPADALAGFGVGTLLGGAFQGVGHALTPAITRLFPATAADLSRGATDSVVGGAWRTVFTPGPELSRLYGFSDNIQRAAEQTARSPAVQGAVSPLLQPQQRAAALWDLIHEAEAGQHPGVDVDLLRGQYDTEVRSILTQQLDPVESAFRLPVGHGLPPDTVRAFDNSLRMAPNGTGNRVRVPITSSGGTVENPDVLSGVLELPEGWIHDTILPGLTQSTLPSASSFRNQLGLEASTVNNLARRLERTTPTGKTQVWAITPEREGGYLMATEVPAFGQDIHRMTGRARYPQTARQDKAEAAKVFLTFKTENPGRFFENDGWRLDFDNPNPGPAGRFDDRIPRGKSDFLDKVMDFRNIYLNPETIRAGYEAQLAGASAKQKYVQEMLAGPTAGKQIANFFETYTVPTDYQLKASPEGRAILSLHQALFDAAESRKLAVMHGVASIPSDKSALGALFAPPDVSDGEALASQLRKTVQEDPNALELIRKFNNGEFPVESIAGTPAGQWIQLALKVNDRELSAINGAIEALRTAGASDSRIIPYRENHFGISRHWEGSNLVPIYRAGAVEPDAVVAGNSQGQAERKAKDWMAARAADLAARGKAPEVRRMGKAYVVGKDGEIPSFIRMSALEPGLLEPRQGLMGYEHQYEPYKHVDDFVAELDGNYSQRWRYAASTMADALSAGKLAQLYSKNKTAFNIVRTRIAQLKGQKGPIDERLNQIVDTIAAPYIGTNSLTKTAEAINGTMFHLLQGVGNVATPILNMTSVLQTHLPGAIHFLTSDPAELRSMGYMLPRFGADGLPRPGINYVTDPIGVLWGGVKNVTGDNPRVMAVMNELFNTREMGAGLANEFSGQDRTIAARASEGIRGPEDLAYWGNRLSSLLMQKTEQVSRTIAAGISLESMFKFEKMNGTVFTHEQLVANAKRFVRLTNYGYFAADRPMMYTTPLGAVFGNQKTWMTNYLFAMAHYFGLGAKNGNWAPALFATGTTAVLGGVFAVPLIGQGIDAFSQFFTGKPAQEYMFEQMGTGGNAISFGLPAMFGMSLQGNVAAPGANLAHDTNFFFTIVALERAKLMGRALGRAWDDQVTLGLNPLKDQLLRRQFMQGFAPRAVYRTFEAIMGDQLRSAATGYPLVREFGFGARVMSALGFQSTDIAIQYSAYEALLADKAEMTRKIGLFGDAYAQATLAHNSGQMQELLQQAAVQGLDINSVMHSSQTRLRNAGRDMFGRQFNQEQLDQYQATLAAGGRHR